MAAKFDQEVPPSTVARTSAFGSTKSAATAKQSRSDVQKTLFILRRVAGTEAAVHVVPPSLVNAASPESSEEFGLS